MNHKPFLIALAELIEDYRPKFDSKRLRRFLPTPGNVIFTILVLSALFWAQSVGAFPAAVPAASATSTGTIAYQGRLADAAGAPLTGTYSMIFRIYNVASGATPLWSEQWTGPNSVQVSDGLFNVMLGSMTPISQTLITSNNNLWLGITVGTDNEMLPRVQLGSVPFAVQALTVPDGSITQAKMAPDVNLLPPAGSITTTMIADGAIGTAQIADGAVAQVDAPSLIRSLNGDGSKVQSGVATKYTAGAVEEDIDVTFPIAFSQTPVVIISNCTFSNQTNWNSVSWMVVGDVVSPTGFRARYKLPALSAGTFRGCWIAMGS